MYIIIVNNLELDNTIDINYDGSVSTFDFTDLYLSYNINDVVSVETDYEITTNGDLFEIVGNSEDGYSLNLKEFDGTQNFTIKVGDYLEKEFVVNVIDNSSSPFELKFENTDKYMYRLGNANEVKLSSLFGLIEGKNITNKTIKFNIYDASKTTGDNILSNIATSGEGFSASYTKELTALNWENSTIKFNGSGVAILEIGTGNLTTRLVVEVIDGVNVTKPSQIGGTQNLIFINDINYIKGVDYSDVSYLSINGITLYGNGFSFNAKDYVATTNCMIALENGNIDNLVINGPVVPEVVYGAYTKYYASGIQTYGNCQITNSFISGFKSPIKGQTGKLYIENSTLDGGVYSNLEIFGSSSLTLNNVTTIQVKKNTTVGDDLSKTVLGAGIVFSAESTTENCELIIEGYLNQYNWVNKSDGSNLPEDYALVFNNIFTNSNYSGYIHKIDGVDHINTGIVFSGTRNNIGTDNRINKSEVPYSSIVATVLGGAYTGTVYTYNNSHGYISTENLIYEGYTSVSQTTLKPKFNFTNVGTIPSENDDYYYYYDGSIHVGIEIGGNYSFNVNDGLSITKYDSSLAYNVLCDGYTILNNVINFNRHGNYILKYTVTDNNFFDINGNRISNSINYSFEINIEVSITSIPNAEISFDNSNNAIYGMTGNYVMIFGKPVGDPDYKFCLPILEGLTIKDYTIDGEYNLDITSTSLPDGLSISASGDSSFNGSESFKLYNGKLYYCSGGAINNKGTDSIVVTYKYIGKNNQTVTETRTFTFTSSTSHVEWKKFTNA